jgi:uncharacterized membrane protein YphA (DoxX/SURF4 family)
MEALNHIGVGWIAVRLPLPGVYLYALYMNTRNAAARAWLVEHTAYIFSFAEEPKRSRLAKGAAIAGALMMFMGAISLLLGLEGRIGALLLLVFTAGGIYQHKRECEVAMKLGEELSARAPAKDKPQISTLQWSGYSGNFSSGLKNWALCGICAAIIAWGTGPWTISDYVGSLLFS